MSKQYKNEETSSELELRGNMQIKKTLIGSRQYANEENLLRVETVRKQYYFLAVLTYAKTA